MLCKSTALCIVTLVTHCVVKTKETFPFALICGDVRAKSMEEIGKLNEENALKIFPARCVKYL